MGVATGMLEIYAASWKGVGGLHTHNAWHVWFLLLSVVVLTPTMSGQVLYNFDVYIVICQQKCTMFDA